jgi:streptomycin 6-kinase
VSPDAVPLVRHDALLVLVGRDPDDGGAWARWWDGAGQAELLADARFVGALTLRGTEERDLVVHLVFTRGDDTSAQDAHAAVLARQPGLPLLYHAAYVRQHGGHPRWYV